MVRLGLAIDLGGPSPAGRLDEVQPVVDAAEEQGLDSVWAGESYLGWGRALHLPSALLVLANLAARTGLALGTGVLLVRTYPPARLAYDAGMVNELSRGRLTLGVGLGHLDNQRLAGWSDVRGGTLFDHALEHLHRVRTTQARDGGGPAAPPVLVGGAGERAVERALTWGDGYYAATNYSDDLLRAQAARYRDAAGTSGTVAVNRLCVVSADRDAALATVERFFAPVRELYLGRSAWDIGRDAAGGPSWGPLLAGTPADVLGGLRRYREWGVTRVNLRVAPVGTPGEVSLTTLRLVGSDVVPALDGPGR